MKQQDKLQKRKSNRLCNYDYSQNGAYFVTLCIQNKQNKLWANVGASRIRPNETPPLSKLGTVVNDAIQNISKSYTVIIVDKYVIMPNHLHMIILIENENNQSGRSMIAPTLSRIIKQFKGFVTKQIGASIWQKSFYDHVIRNQKDYESIWTYVEENPLKWKEDNYYNPY